MAETFVEVDCSTESGLAKALKNRQNYQEQGNLSNVDTTSMRDECVDAYKSDNVEQKPTSVNTAVATSSSTTLPDIRELTDEELAEQQQVVENWFTMAKQTLKHNSFSDDSEKEESVAKTAICMNGWLLSAEVEKVDCIKRDVDLGKI